MPDKKNSEKDASKPQDMPLDYCTTAPSAEHARAADVDEPCDDYTAGKVLDGREGLEASREGDLLPQEGDALLVVDLQNDFLPGGALAVPGGEEVVPILNRYMKIFEERGLPVLATRDYHPPDHGSFKAQGGPWPPHCVRGTAGAAFVPGLHLPGGVTVVSTGEEVSREGYSGFEQTELETELQRRGVRRLWIGGLATDYCVRYTVVEALRRGYQVLLLIDAIRAVNVNPMDGQSAIDDMTDAGAGLMSLEQL